MMKSNDIAAQEEKFNTLLEKAQQTLITEKANLEIQSKNLSNPLYDSGAIKTHTTKLNANASMVLKSSINQSLNAISSLQLISKDEFDDPYEIERFKRSSSQYKITDDESVQSGNEPAN